MYILLMLARAVALASPFLCLGSDAHFAAKRWVFVKSIGGQRVGGLRCGGHVQRLAW